MRPEGEILIGGGVEVFREGGVGPENFAVAKVDEDGPGLNVRHVHAYN